jgi:hypothetical protein
MNIIKGVLKEELENSLRIRKRYLAALADFPKGSLVKKEIAGKAYYYEVFREGPKIQFSYKGKLSEAQVQDFKEKQERRRRYKKLIRELDHQISYLKRVLRVRAD